MLLLPALANCTYFLFQGRMKLMAENRSGEPLDPTPDYDCHIPKSVNINLKTMSSEEAYEASQVRFKSGKTFFCRAPVWFRPRNYCLSLVNWPSLRLGTLILPRRFSDTHVLLVWSRHWNTLSECIKCECYSDSCDMGWKIMSYELNRTYNHKSICLDQIWLKMILSFVVMGLLFTIEICIVILSLQPVTIHSISSVNRVLVHQIVWNRVY